MKLVLWARRLGSLRALVVVFLLIEFLDEFIYGAREAALPVIRTDLGLDYAQIGLLLTLPPLLANLLFEPMLGILGDVWRRRALVMGGGIVIAIAMILIAASSDFGALMLAMIVANPASGAFVGLAQSTLMDAEPARREQNMARWTAAGSLGESVGALTIGLCIAVGIGWRPYFALTAVFALVLVARLRRLPFPSEETTDDENEPASFKDAVRGAMAALRRKEVLRWLALLEFANLLMDVLYGYLALYFVDVVGVDEAQAGFAVAVWAVVGLAGDFALLPLLERANPIKYLRFSAALEAVLFTAFLIVPGLLPKLILIGVIGFFNSGWYAILAANLYGAMPGQSGAVMTVSNMSGLVGSTIPLMIGLAAERFGLGPTMTFPLFGCAALLILLPRRKI